MREHIVNALLDAWAVVQPVECAGCGREDRGVCSRCRVELASPVRVRRLPDLNVPVHAAGRYRGVRRRLILAGKDAGRGDALRALAPGAQRAILAAAEHTRGTVEVCWVPSSPRAFRRRGYDPVRTVLRAARVPVARVLVARSTPAQKSLDREARLAAAPERFRAVGRVAQRRFILVDDVVTTGATVRAAVRTLRRARADVVGVACLATVQQRGGDS